MLRLGFHSLRFRVVTRSFFTSRTLDARSLALQFAQIIKPRTPHFTASDHVNRAEGRGMQRENSLNPPAKANAPHRERRARRPPLLRNHHALKRLQALLFLLAFAFLQPHIYSYAVARTKLRQIFAQLRFMQFSYYRIHCSFPADPLKRRQHTKANP